MDWLKLIDVSGPFLSAPVLAAEWPDLDSLELDDEIRRKYREWQDGNRDGWIEFVLNDLLEWRGAIHSIGLNHWALDVPEHDTTIVPSFSLNDPVSDSPVLLGMITDGSPVARIKGSDWPATPADRLAMLLRHTGVELGLISDGRWYALVWSPPGGVTTVAVFDSIAWNEPAERQVLRAFVSLLRRRRFFGVPPDHRLPALLRKSLDHQEEITEALGVQARQAVELLGKAGHEEEVTLRTLEPLTAVDLAERYKKSGIGSSRALAKKLAPLNGEERAQAETRLYAITRDHALVQRLLSFYRIVRKDLRGDPVVILPGGLYVTESALRSRSGTHYTPRHLAEQVAEGALEPLVYTRGPLQTADRSRWKLRPSEEILSLKVADVACGSGAFLVAACRYLAGKVIEAWSAEGNTDAKVVLSEAGSESRLALDVMADPLIIKARRLVIQQCLYGVDINPTAVEICKLSLWLISMDPDRPFTFVDDRLVVGDSLLGITSIDQLEWMHLDPRSGRELHEYALFDSPDDIQALLRDIAWEREHLVDIQDDEIADIHKKRRILTDTQNADTDGNINTLRGPADRRCSGRDQQLGGSRPYRQRGGRFRVVRRAGQTSGAMAAYRPARRRF